LVGPVGVVEPFVFPECVEQMPLVPDQGAVEQFVAAVWIQRSMMEFILGIWTPVRITWMPASARMASNS
jgi:hypothetical protein